MHVDLARQAAVAGERLLMVLGEERVRVQALASLAAPGSVQVAPATYESLGGSLDEDLGSCLLMAQFEGDTPTEITLTVAPDGQAAFSTFAGLGLT